MMTTGWLDNAKSLPLKAIVAAISWALAGTLAFAAPGGNGKGGKGGDDGGNDEIPVETTFNCPAAAGVNNCGIDLGDGLGWAFSPFQADGAAGDAAYSDGDANVRNRFNSAGIFVLTTHERSNRFGERTVFWDLSVGPGSVDLPSIGSFTSTDQVVGVDHKTVIQVGKFYDTDLRTMQPTDILTNVPMILDLIFDTGRNSADVIWVRYVDDDDPQSAPTNGQTQCPPGSTANGVEIERLENGSGGEARWVIRAAASDIACVYTPADVENFDTLGATKDWSLGAFELYVTEKP